MYIIFIRNGDVPKRHRNFFFRQKPDVFVRYAPNVKFRYGLCHDTINSPIYGAMTIAPTYHFLQTEDVL